MKTAACLLLLLFLIAESSTAQIRFNKYVIGKSGERVPGFCVSDIDLDGDLDIIGCKKLEGKLVCWKKQGPDIQNYEEVIIAEGLNYPLYVTSGDLNGDGFPDLVASLVLAHTVNVWLNPGLNTSGNWTPYTIARDFHESHGVETGDINGDGLNDIIATAALDNTIAWWANNGNTPATWTKRVITDSFAYTQCVQLTDIDNDNDPDILAAALNGNSVSLWINDGKSNPSWTQIAVDNSFRGAHWAEAADLDKDGDLDILGAAFYDSQIAAWYNLGGNPVTFRKQVISGNFSGPVAVTSGDMDLDGDVDILGAAWSGSSVAWFENKTNTDGSWARVNISTNFSGAWPVSLSDLDQDGDLDVIAGGDILGNPGISSVLTIWENTIIQTGIGQDLLPADPLMIEYLDESKCLRIKCKSGYLGELEVSVFDTLGRLRGRKIFYKTSLVQEFSFNLSSLLPGDGILVIAGIMGNARHTGKVFVRK